MGKLLEEQLREACAPTTGRPNGLPSFSCGDGIDAHPESWRNHTKISMMGDNGILSWHSAWVCKEWPQVFYSRQMHKRRALLALLMGILFVSVGFARGSQEKADSGVQPIVLRLADNQPIGYPTVVGDEDFARRVGEYTDGRIIVECTPKASSVMRRAPLSRSVRRHRLHRSPSPRSPTSSRSSTPCRCRTSTATATICGRSSTVRSGTTSSP